MKSLLKYKKAFSLGLQNSMEYRVDFLLSLLSGVINIIIMCSLWTAIFNNSTSSTVYGYTYAQMIVYSVLSGLVSKLVSSGFEYEIADDIKNGGLNKYIVRPIWYLPYRICSFLGGKSIQSAVVFLISIGTVLLINIVFDFHFEFYRIILVIPSLVFALFLNFLIFYSVSVVAFWLTEAAAVFLGVNIISNVLSGGVFPLDVLGANIYRVLDLLPFKYIVFFPISILNGKYQLGDILSGMLVQSVWIIVLAIVSNFLWKVGMKKYIAIGG